MSRRTFDPHHGSIADFIDDNLGSNTFPRPPEESFDDSSSQQNLLLDGRIPSRNPSKWNSFRRLFSGVTIEPMLFIVMYSMATTGVVKQNLYIDRTCRFSLNYSSEICNNLTAHDDIETEVDKLASQFSTYKTLIELGFPVLISLFLGPWTDIHGTKWPMLIPQLGYVFTTLLDLVFAQYIPTATPSILLLSSVPISLAGGVVSLFMSAFAFMAKVTTIENRTFRVAMLEAVFYLGAPLGTLAGGYLFKYGGYTAVFGVSAGLFLLSFVYGLIAIEEESSGNEEGNMCTDLFNIQAVKDMFNTVVQPRRGIERRLLLLMLLTMFLRVFVQFGFVPNLYPFTRLKFHWDQLKFTRFTVSDSFISIAGGYFMIATCMKMFKLPDPVIGILSTIGILFAQFLFAFASAGWMFYCASVLQMFAGLITIVLRSMVSKIVEKEELGRVFTFLACGEASMPLIGVIAYSFVYTRTVHTFPGAMFLVSASGYVVILSSFIYLCLKLRTIREEASHP